MIGLYGSRRRQERREALVERVLEAKRELDERAPLCQCRREPQVNGGRCLECRGRSMA